MADSGSKSRPLPSRGPAGLRRRSFFLSRQLSGSRAALPTGVVPLELLLIRPPHLILEERALVLPLSPVGPPR